MSYRIMDLRTHEQWYRDTRDEADELLDMLDPERDDRWRYEVKRFI